ncbi:hypothetical protein GF348_24120 [candidate division KSB3 bacterium]|nr:hypothetical protein [candidate division KSB3 bacterium]
MIAQRREEALPLLAQAEEARAEADADLEGVLAQLGFDEWRGTCRPNWRGRLT